MSKKTEIDGESRGRREVEAYASGKHRENRKSLYARFSHVYSNPNSQRQADYFQEFADETAAETALSSGAIDRYLLIPADYPATEPILIDPDFSPFTAQPETEYAYLLTYNLVNDAALAQTLLNPTGKKSPAH